MVRRCLSNGWKIPDSNDGEERFPICSSETNRNIDENLRAAVFKKIQILIHPFREGNGRVARLLADLMATQANMPPLNYSAIGLLEKPDGFEQYIKAIHAGLNRDYLPMRDIFATLLRQSV
ncbi:MAG: vbhT [Gammaproteobacteria bacterium]|nr:vbhT [Gammaproteobacteria bacterium]